MIRKYFNLVSVFFLLAGLISISNAQSDREIVDKFKAEYSAIEKSIKYLSLDMFYLVLYDEKNPDYANLVFAFKDGKRINIDKKNSKFLREKHLPDRRNSIHPRSEV